METYILCSSIGLALDMLGIIIIFFFGISPRLDIKGNTYRVSGEVDENEIRKAKIYKLLSWIGLILIFMGFLFQFIGNCIK